MGALWKNKVQSPGREAGVPTEEAGPLVEELGIQVPLDSPSHFLEHS